MKDKMPRIENVIVFILVLTNGAKRKGLSLDKYNAVVDNGEENETKLLLWFRMECTNIRIVHDV